MRNNPIVDTPVIGQKVVSGEAFTQQIQSLLESYELIINSGKLNEYTVSTVPDPTKYTGSAIMITDQPGGYSMALSNGTAWALVGGGGVSVGDLLAINNLSDVGSAATSRTNLGVDPSGTDNSTNVTLTGTGSYLSLVGQAVTVDPIELGDIVTATAGAGDTIVHDGVDWVLSSASLIRVVEEVAGGLTFYVGDAEIGTATSTAGWRIKRIVYTGDASETLFADGDSNFDNIMDDYLSLSYS